jgi:hypothetical protein
LGGESKGRGSGLEVRIKENKISEEKPKIGRSIEEV